MAGSKRNKEVNSGSAGGAEVTKPIPRACAIAERGIESTSDIRALMSALVSDMLGGHVSANVVSTAVRANNTILKSAEMDHKYGTPNESNTKRTLLLS